MNELKPCPFCGGEAIQALNRDILAQKINFILWVVALITA